jgi:hypothetical protein
MATIILGSARHDENGTYTNGTRGDQLQTSATNDTIGEVSMQEMYVHNKGWNILRPVDATKATKLAAAMKTACNNAHIGYSQTDRNDIISKGINTTINTNADCSSLVRACIINAMGKDVGAFSTGNEVTALVKSGLFTNVGGYVSQASTPLYNGDVLVTKTKGHTVIVVSGNPRTTSAVTAPTSNSGKYTYKNVDYSKVFDPTYYNNKYTDLNNTYHGNATQLFTHFYTYGMKEGRQASKDFNVAVYKAKNADLIAAYGSNLAKYYEHYCIYGYKENRVHI